MYDWLPKKRSPLVNCEVMEKFSEMLRRLKLTESWRGKIPTQQGFTKEDKEAFNLLIFVILEPIMLTEDDDLSPFPAYVLRRLFIKAATWDSKPDNKEFFRNTVLDFDKKIKEHALNAIETPETHAFVSYMETTAEQLSKKVRDLYKAARALATLIEYEETKENFRPDVALKTEKQIYQELAVYSHLPHFAEIAMGMGKYAKLKELLHAISWSRYTFRWQGYFAPIRCSILSHMLESALVSYLMNLEAERDADWIQDFRVMLFHDIAEVWTDDIPSPVKVINFEYVIPKLKERLKKQFGTDETTLRKISELQELDALEANFYACLPDEVERFFRNGVMLEDIKDTNRHDFYKAADYFAADMEVWWNMDAKEPRYRNIHRESYESGKRTFAQMDLLKKFIAGT